MYDERDVFDRVRAKVRRTFRRPHKVHTERRRVLLTDARAFPRVRNIRAAITSPPYMNQLDYVRDNRLRLWFIDRSLPVGLDPPRRDRDKAFFDLMRGVCLRLEPGLAPGGLFVLVVGDATRKGGPRGRAAFMIRRLFNSEPLLRDFTLEHTYSDRIPDIRRSRRECRGTKTETVLVYRKPRKQ
jgi:hypothetical protein